MAGGITDFLMSVGMGRHLNMFHMRGYDDESDIPYLNLSDLQTVGITDPSEIIVILKAAHSYKQRSEYDLLRWLREHGLSHYYEGFIQSGQVSLSDIAQLNLPDEDVYDELEITLPGHKRRLERAVHALRKRQRPEGSEGGEEEDVMVTEGWWGYPTYLPHAKYPFLCVKATIQSTCDAESLQSVDFMVDSGSDVSTLREEVVQSLNLEPITTIRSFGAHGSARTTMYRAFLTIGDCKLEIEVIGSSYDSLGSRVFRHFNHRIDKSRHKWFRASNKNTWSLTPSETTEAETVSVLPERERGTPYSRIFQENPSGSSSSSRSRTGGDGGSSSHGDGGPAVCPGGAAPGKGDETDNFWSSSPHKRTSSSGVRRCQLKNTTSSSQLSPPRQNFARGSSPFSSPYKNTSDPSWLSTQHRKVADLPPRSSSVATSSCSPSSAKFSRRPRCSSDTTDQVHFSQDNFPHMYHDRMAGTSSESSPPRHGSFSWTDQRGTASPNTVQRTSGHQSGHLMISEDGTISLSFGRQARQNRPWEDAEGSRSESDL
ncbi:uncharacterized protein LOC143300475 [Babylonia areolata]|uniref:uncharacterized protein LOC143300475 n=1 Tax=Babylonia areolata TaxID=304850 RepID=UPI003FD6608B